MICVDGIASFDFRRHVSEAIKLALRSPSASGESRADRILFPSGRLPTCSSNTLINLDSASSYSADLVTLLAARTHLPTIKMEYTVLFDSELEQLEKSIRSCSMSPLQANRRRRNLARTPRGSPMTARSRPFAQRHRAAHAIESSPAMEQPPAK
jgi:hypothetical protein